MQTFKAIKQREGEVEYLGHINSAVCEKFFNDHLDYHPSKHATPNPQSLKSTNCQNLGGDLVFLAR